jgi:hypothetical protein
VRTRGSSRLASAKGYLSLLLCLAGCSSAAPPAPPIGAVTIQIGPGGETGIDDASKCNATPVPFSITMSPLAPLVESSSVDDAARATCTVHPDGDTFDLNALVSLAPGESFSIVGQMSAAASSVRASFEHSGVTYASQGECTVEFEGEMGIIGGRVWALVYCPEAADGAGDVCFASALFAFANCAE